MLKLEPCWLPIACDLGSLNKQRHKTRINHAGPSGLTLPMPGPELCEGEVGSFHWIGATREEASACRHLYHCDHL